MRLACTHMTTWTFDLVNASAYRQAAGRQTHGRDAHGLQALIERVRQKLDADAFAQFKQHTAQFARGSLSPPDVHMQLVSLGLAGLIPDMAALLPDASKRASLLAVHSASFGSAPIEVYLNSRTAKSQHRNCAAELTPDICSV